ncbi:MAG: NTP transferase domain-containing protein, partial [Bradymonadaceae bacterium]
MTTSFQSVILAAGKGTRMRSQRPKVLHEVLGVPMVDYAVRASLNAGADRAVVVVGYGAERVRTALQDRPYADSIDFAHQEKQLGTGHAVWSARDALEHGSEWTAVLSGDAPLITSQAVDSLVEGTRRANLPLGLVTAHLEDPTGYGRIVRDSDEELVRIVEETDATPTQRDIDEVNAGTYVGRTQFL